MTVPVLPPFPRRLEIELSSACNLHCTYCPRQYLPPLGEFVNMALFERVMTELDGHPEIILTLHRRGESLLHPELAQIMERVAGRFAAVQLATNGSVLTREKWAPLVRGLTFLSFSLDVPETFNETRRGADYHRVEQNILGFLDFNHGSVQTQASMVRVETTTDEQCDRFVRLWQNRVDRVRIYEEHSKNGVFGAMQHRRPERKPCTMPFYELLMYADGSVGRCNHDWNGPPLGNLNTQSIADIWTSDAMDDLRRQHLSLAFTDSVCATCDAWYPETGVQATGIVVEKA